MRCDEGVGYILIIMTALIVTSCDYTRRSLGLERSEPDEFTVCDRPPLSVPPSVDLKPPLSQKSGDAEAKMTRKKAENLVLKRSLASGAQSTVETNLLQKAGAAQGESDIREVLSQEEKARQPEEELVQKILFWQTPKAEGDVINPVEEKKRLTGKATESSPSTPSGGFE